MQFNVIIHRVRLTIPVRWGKFRTPPDVRMEGPDMSWPFMTHGPREDWLEHKNDDVLFDQERWCCQFMSYPTCGPGACWMLSWPQQEGVPREWWAIEPRFFQPKVPPWYAQNQNTGQTLPVSVEHAHRKGSWCCTWRKLSDPVSDGGEDLVNLWLSAFG